MRNPWGHFEFTEGEYSDTSAKWTDDLKKKVNFKSKGDDGTFFMTPKELMNNFVNMSVCFYRDSYRYSGITITP